MLDLGIRLQLLIGQTIPVPAPFSVVDSLIDVEVTNSDQQRDGFQMKFSLGKGPQPDYGLLQSGILDPPNRVIIIAIFKVMPQVLIDGIITDHLVTASNTPGQSTLTVTGQDISLKLEFEERNETYPNHSDSAIVMSILTRPDYVSLGLVPQVTPTTDVPIQTDRVPSQQKTDLAHIQELARRNGFVFYIEPTNVPGVNTAFWGVDNRLGLPQPALTMNMGTNTNVDSPMNFRYNALGPVEPQVTFVEPITKTAITIPIPASLRPSLTSKPAPALRQTLPRDTANLNPIQAALRALSSSSQSSDAATVSGEVDAVRYGRALRARRLVGVRGVGLSFDGNYYVKQVTHRIKRGEFKQSFMLTREGRGASASKVAT
jgi:hypothetical protein